MGREQMLSGRGEQQRGLALREEQVRLQSVEPRLRGRSQWCRGGGVRRAAKIDDEQDAASEAAEGGERRSGDGERPKEEGRLGALQERQEQDGARPRERDGERGEGAFDGSGLMQSAMQPFRASDRAAFCTAFGSFGHAPLRIEASHRQAAHILMAWRGVAWHGMAWPALWLAGSSERHACRAPTIPTFFNPSPSRLSAQPRRKAPQPGEQHADSRQARAPAAIKSQSQKKMCWTQRGKQGFECTRPFASSPAAVHSRAGASLSLSKLAGRQPVQAALPIATSEPSCRRCVVRPARKFTLPTSAPYRCVPSPTLLPLPRRAGAWSGTRACKLPGFVVDFWQWSERHRPSCQNGATLGSAAATEALAAVVSHTVRAVIGAACKLASKPAAYIHHIPHKLVRSRPTEPARAVLLATTSNL